MTKKYELAKKQGLNWQALLIEETQTEIKELIKDLTLKGKSKLEIGKAVEKKINECVDELESENLKAEAQKGLQVFANRVYVILALLFVNVNYSQLQSISRVARDIGTIKDLQETSTILGNQAYNKGVPVNIYAKDYMELVKQRIDTLSKLEAKEDYTSRMTLRNSAEIQVRQERREEQLQELKDKGVNLVWIVPHANCSSRCQPFQGKLYSLDGTYGEIDGIRYEPLENATDVYETTKNGKIYKNGCLSGFNCRHQTQAYAKGNKPTPIPAKVIDKEREINNKQRYLERGVRSWRDRALQWKGIDNAEYVYSKNKANEWNRKYIEYSRNNNVAFYPDRTKII